MSLAPESALTAVLQTQCPRVDPAGGSPNAVLPHVIWQPVGGESWRYVDNTAPDMRHQAFQVTAWAETNAAAIALMRQIEEALCSASTLIARPLGELQAEPVPELKRVGISQDFEVIATR